MKHNLWHRFLAAVMAGVLCCSMLPVSAFAAELPATASTVAIEQTVEDAPGETEDTELPDTTAPPVEDSLQTTEDAPENAERATPEAAINKAQAFIDAVNALDRDTAISKANAWGLAKLAADADPENAELAAAFEVAIAEADTAAEPVYAADDLYSTIPEEEREDETVVAAYTVLAALFMAMQNAMENPTMPDADAPSTVTDAESILFGDLPDAPTGSYIGSLGLPVATGETKISIAGWNSDLTDANAVGRLDGAPLNEDDITLMVGKESGKDYAIVPIAVQVEYPGNGGVSFVTLPKKVTLLSYDSTTDNLKAASEAETAAMLHDSYTEVSASATGLYVKADSNFTAQFTYTDADGQSLTKTLHVQLADNGETARTLSASGASTYAVSGPTPPFTSGVITKTQRGSSTWLLWFNGVEAYCCSHGLAGRVNGCPTYGYSYTSMLEPGQKQDTHEATQINIWGALGQLSLGLLAQQHEGKIVDSQFADVATTYALADTELLNYCYQYYDDIQMAIILDYPDSQAAQLYLDSAKAAMGANNVVNKNTVLSEMGFPSNWKDIQKVSNAKVASSTKS